jgi:mono/diheme cytochrome c family protein
MKNKLNKFLRKRYKADNQSQSFEGRRLLKTARSVSPLVAGIAFSLLLSGAHTSAQTPAKNSSSAGAVENGQKIFVAQGCGKCHGSAGQGGSGDIAGPRISPTRQSFPAFSAQVREPQGAMPPYSPEKISDADLRAVYAFLKGNESGEASTPAAKAAASGNPQSGKVLYTKYGCYECHGRYAEGSTATGPRLNPNSLSSDAFVSYIRHPANNMPPYTEKVVFDSELADIFAFLHSLPAPPKVESIPLLK